MTNPIEREAVARAIARINGDDFDEVPRNKPHWIQERGEFGGRSRDINEPFQTDYLEMADAAIAEVCDWHETKDRPAPTSGLIDMYDGARRYNDCYYDKICGEHRTTGNSGVLMRIPRNATHWKWPSVPRRKD